MVTNTPRRHLGALIVPPAAIVAAAATFGAGPTTAVISTFCIGVFSLFAVRHLTFVIAALSWADRDLAQRRVLPTPGHTPKVSVIVPCHNEAVVVDALVAALGRLDYPDELLEIICVNDKSTDDTGAILDAAAAVSDRNLTVLHRPDGTGGGKSGALNDAAAIATGDILVVFDADHQPRPDAIARIVRHFADPNVACVMGQCLIENIGASRLSYTIALDYLAGYLINEYGRQAVFELPAYGGANCAVRADILAEIGGWNTSSVTEDTDLTLQVLLGGYRTRFDVTAQDYETAVVDPRTFIRQRYRWARGHQQVWRDYRWRVLSSRRLSLTDKIETILFLLVYHTPTVCLLAVGLLAAQLAGVDTVGFGSVPLAAFLFAGPLLELAGGLILVRARKPVVWSIVWFLPLFVLSMGVCTKALIDGLLGRPYSWVKTTRHVTEPASC